MKYKLVIFDMDGTILDTITDLMNAANYALIKSGAQPRSEDEIRRFIGNGIKKLMERCMPEGAGKEDYDNCLYDFMMHYDVHYNDNTCPYDGIIELIDAVRAKGIKTAVVSNKNDKAMQALTKQHFPGCFDFAIGVTDTRAIKPAPDMCQYTLEQLGIDKKDACYIGDTEVDMQTAENSGLDMIGVSWGFRGRKRLEELGCRTIVDRPEEILGIVAE